MIQLSGAGKRFGHKLLFENLDWLITPNDRVGVVGANGTGKSTLLNALVGAERSIVSPVAGTTRDAVDEAVVETKAVLKTFAAILRISEVESGARASRLESVSPSTNSMIMTS